MVTIDIKNNSKIEYRICFFDRLSVIYNDSGICADILSDFMDIVLEAKRIGKHAGFNKITCEKKILVLLEYQLLEYLTSDFTHTLDNTIVFFDKYGCSNETVHQTISQILNKYKTCYIVCIGRKLSNMDKLSANSLCRIYYDESSNINYVVPAYSVQKFDESINLILIEDSKSEFEFYKRYYKDSTIPIISSYGDSGLQRIVSILPPKFIKPYIICNSVSFAKYYVNIEEALLASSNNFTPCVSDRVFSLESFEYLVLKSNWIKSKLDIKLSEDVFENSEYISEKDIEKNLKAVFSKSCDGCAKSLDEFNCTLHNCCEDRDCLKSKCECFTGYDCQCELRQKGDKCNMILEKYVEYLPRPTVKSNINFFINTYKFKDFTVGLRVKNLFIIFIAKGKHVLYSIEDKSFNDFASYTVEEFEDLDFVYPIGVYGVRETREKLKEYLNDISI